MAGVKGRKFSQETRQILREQKLGEKNPFYGKTHTPEVREKIRQAHLGRVQGIEWTKKRAMKGEKNPAWKGGISKSPYCSKFNEEFKRRVRDFWENKCFVCGKTKGERGQNRELSVHHVYGDKFVCCNDKKPIFVIMCSECHTKLHMTKEIDAWDIKFEEYIMNNNNGKCYFSQEEYYKK
jgi:hypothetical protein